jgi:GT2 family glycosyltransferase
VSSVAFVVLASDDPRELQEKFQVALASTKEWVLVVHEGDAHLEIAQRLLRGARDADVVYADEVGDSAGVPILKPARVGPHSLLSYNVVGRPALVRREAALRAGGMHHDAGRAGEHDLFLRLHHAGARFAHVAAVLAGRTPTERQHPGLSDDTRRVVADILAARGIEARVLATPRPSVVTWSPQRDPWPRVDIVIPTRDRVDLLRQCVESVLTSTYPNYAITILDNDSVEPATLDYFATTPHRVVSCPGAFNYAAIMNRGVAHCTGDYVVTLNNDTVVRTRDWLEQMVGVASLDDVSVVGVTLVDQYERHEHDGIVIAPYPQHLRRGINYLVEDDYTLARRDVAAVTGAVQMFSRAQYLELEGMDERLSVVMNDVDLCLRSQVRGRHVVMLPDVVLSHFAGSTRGRLDPLSDRNYFVRRWDVFGSLRDPYFPESLRLYGTRIDYVTTVSN